jgi:hypothetical protein
MRELQQHEILRLTALEGRLDRVAHHLEKQIVRVAREAFLRDQLQRIALSGRRERLNAGPLCTAARASPGGEQPVERDGVQPRLQ